MILRYGCNTNKSESLVTIIRALLLKAHSKTILSALSRQSFILILGLTIIAASLIMAKRYSLSFLSIRPENLGLEQTLIISSIKGLEMAKQNFF